MPREAFDSSTVGDYDGHVFVRQLNFVSPPALILQRAIQDYYRATTQSARWIEDNLVALPEVKQFQDDLLDEWERAFAWAIELLPENATANDKATAGRELLRKCMDNSAIHIRESYREPFYFRGKLHQLADERQIGWHPDYVHLLTQLLVGVS